MRNTQQYLIGPKVYMHKRLDSAQYVNVKCVAVLSYLDLPQGSFLVNPYLSIPPLMPMVNGVGRSTREIVTSLILNIARSGRGKVENLRWLLPKP